jgi:hypothetical protein
MPEQARLLLATHTKLRRDAMSATIRVAAAATIAVSLWLLLMP